MPWHRFNLAAVATALSLLGCRTPPPEPVTLDTAEVTPRLSYEPLAAVLGEGVEDGRLRREGLEGELSQRLDEQLRLLAVTGPTATPGHFDSDDARLGYWFNARAAWAMRLATLEGKLPDKLPPAGLERRPVPLDGRTLTLEDVDARIEQLGGWRALAAAPGVRLDRAPLPEAPAGAREIETFVREQFNALIADERRVALDYLRQTVRFPPLLWRRRTSLIAAYRSRYRSPTDRLVTALLPLVDGSAHRRLQEIVGWRERPTGPRRALAIAEE